MTVIASLSFLLYLQALWLVGVSGFLNALSFALRDQSLIQLGILAYFGFFLGRQCDGLGLKDTNRRLKPIDLTIIATSLIFVLQLFNFLGLDSGCYVVGSDPLFGGGGYQECEPDYEKQVIKAEAAAAIYNFNSKAYFAAKFFVLSIFASLIICLGYFSDKYNRRKHFGL